MPDFICKRPMAVKKLSIPILLFFILVNTLNAQEVLLKKGKYIIRETGKSYTGTFKEYDYDKRLLSETGIKDGLLDGITTIYFPSGAKKEIRSYLGGQKHGIWTTWNEAGGKTAEASFTNGKKDGSWYVWDDKGTKRYEMFYKNGEKKGVWIIWDDSGKIISREEFK